MSSKRTVLVVDDEAFFRQTVIDALDECTDSIVGIGVADGIEALEALEHRDFVAIITDLEMPRMGGLTLIQELLNRQIRIPIVVISAHSTPELERWVTSELAFTVLEKPVDLGELISTIERLLAPTETGKLQGVTLPGLCQLMEMERKTCEVRVRGQNEAGRLLFSNGVLKDAVLRDISGNNAAIQIFSWADPMVEISGRVPLKIKSRVTESIFYLVMEAARLQDEAKRKSPLVKPPPVPPPPVRYSAPTKRSTNRTTAPPPTESLIKTPASTQPIQRTEKNMATISDTLKKLNQLDGFIAAALVDADIGMLLGAEGSGAFNLDVAAAANTEVVRAKRKAISALELGDEIEDILISLKKQYHLIRPMKDRPAVFFYVVVDRAKASLGLARLALAEAEKNVAF